MQSSADDVEEANVDAVEDAYANPDQAIDDIDDDATLADAGQSVEDELQAGNAAWEQLMGGLNCQ